jgi:hypothetical protein
MLRLGNVCNVGSQCPEWSFLWTIQQNGEIQLIASQFRGHWTITWAPWWPPLEQNSVHCGLCLDKLWELWIANSVTQIEKMLSRLQWNNVRSPLLEQTVSTVTSIQEQNAHTVTQGCGSGLNQCGSGSSILAQSGPGCGSGSGSKLKQNFQRQFLSQIFLKSKLQSNQIKKYWCYSSIFFLKK